MGKVVSGTPVYQHFTHAQLGNEKPVNEDKFGNSGSNIWSCGRLLTAMNACQEQGRHILRGFSMRHLVTGG